MFTFWICTGVLQWLCLKAVSVSTFVLGGLRGFTATSDLVTVNVNSIYKTIMCETFSKILFWNCVSWVFRLSAMLQSFCGGFLLTLIVCVYPKGLFHTFLYIRIYA